MIPREIFAYLTLDEREPKRSGLRLIEWADVCKLDGVIIPLLQKSERALRDSLIERARTADLHCYVEYAGELVTAGIDGYVVGRPDQYSQAELERLGRPMLCVEGIEQAAPYLGRLPVMSFLYVDRGQPINEWLTLCRTVQQTGGRLPGYLDDTPGFMRALQRTTYAPLVVKRLALSGNRLGSAAGKTIVPYDFSELVRIARGIQEQAAMLARARLAEAIGDPIPAAEECSVMPQGSVADIAVVIRSKNEAEWIGRTLEAIAHQSRRPKEVVLVDNESTDGTVAIARSFEGRLPMKMLAIRDSEFNFSRALNLGIERTTASWVVSLSAHCVPVGDGWLAAFEQETVREEFRGKRVELLAGVYGRQEPVEGVTSDFDKRDLWITFGTERRVQSHAIFFHNANSMIRRTVWEARRFDETIHGVEDQDWAKKTLADGHVIVYAPSASVQHHHGIHQGRNEERAKRVVKVIELIQQREPITSQAL